MPTYLPSRVSHLVGELAELVPEPDRASFWELARVTEALFHHFGGSRARHVGALYSPFDPDADTVPPSSASQASLEGLSSELGELFARANFRRVPDEDLLTASDRAVLGRLDIDTEIESIEELAVWTRGHGTKAMSQRRARKLFRSVEEEVPTYRRVGVAVRTQDEPWMLLKLFKDVPTRDLELLLPTVRVKMKLLDKLKLSGSGTAAAISVWKLLRLLYSYVPTLTKFLAIPFKVLVLPVVAIVGMIYGGKTFLDYGKVKSSYMTALAEHLYAITMASNHSVLARLGAMAGAEETKEVLLAYTLLAHAGSAGLEPDQLAARAEAFAWDRYRAPLSFDLDDALRKLEELELSWRQDGRLVAVPLDAALRKVDAAWDELYEAPDRASLRLRRERLRE